MAYQEEKKIISSLVKKVGKILCENFGKVEKQFKNKREIVTSADHHAEEIICQILEKEFPDHSILTEETHTQLKDSSYKWIIDPIDGTNNYAYQFPFFCTSIALEYKEKIVLGVVYDPLRKELFEAEINKPAFLNGEKIKVSLTKDFLHSRWHTGFYYNIEKLTDKKINTFTKVLFNTIGVRISGSAVLDLCYVACGKSDGYWEVGIRPWDTAAGKLIVEQAGGKVTDFKGNTYSCYKDNILATNSKLHPLILKILT